MPRLVDQPDKLMGLESASSSDDSEDEDDDHVLDNVEAGQLDRFQLSSTLKHDYLATI